ncbi:hypothetical protein HT031_006123 [Scenedesmus sp. PABB004]|nr:hypothetical protein HT031_006123 [Scenedesmus sp. PABB004]
MARPKELPLGLWDWLELAHEPDQAVACRALGELHKRFAPSALLPHLPALLGLLRHPAPALVAKLLVLLQSLAENVPAAAAPLAARLGELLERVLGAPHGPAGGGAGPALMIMGMYVAATVVQRSGECDAVAAHLDAVLAATAPDFPQAHVALDLLTHAQLAATAQGAPPLLDPGRVAHCLDSPSAQVAGGALQLADALAAADAGSVLPHLPALARCLAAGRPLEVVRLAARVFGRLSGDPRSAGALAPHLASLLPCLRGADVALAATAAGTLLNLAGAPGAAGVAAVVPHLGSLLPLLSHDDAAVADQRCCWCCGAPRSSREGSWRSAPARAGARLAAGARARAAPAPTWRRRRSAAAAPAAGGGRARSRARAGGDQGAAAPGGMVQRRDDAARRMHGRAAASVALQARRAASRKPAAAAAAPAAGGARHGRAVCFCPGGLRAAARPALRRGLAAAPALRAAPLLPARRPRPRSARARELCAARRRRGRGAGGEAAPKKAPSKPRLPGLDSLRFFLIAYIAVGHFVAFATSDAFLVRFFTQVNVWVGAFFVLSGYVAGYTATELGRYEASPRVSPEGAYTVARVAGYYPLYLLVQVVFGAMFAFADAAYNGPVATAAHGLMSLLLVQAWFPGHAEVWNAPTWFLSALTFAMVVLPHALPRLAALRRRGLRALLLGLTAASLLPKLAYSYDLGAWALLEGVCSARAHPNLLLWNVTRFNPFYCLLEVLMGVAAARLVMLDGVNDDGSPGGPAPAPGSALLPVLGLLGVTLARAGGLLPLNDPLTRCLLFVPLFTAALMALHRNTLAGGRGLAGLLAHPALVYLGSISFPIFVLHGALGQVFYKKIIATKLWGGVMPLSFFPAYVAITLAAAAAVQKLFLENKKVQDVSASVSKAIVKAL